MDLIELLRRAPLFEHLRAYDLGLVADLAEEHRLESGMLLCRQADVGATFFVIDTGEALIERVDERGYQRPVGMLRAGDHFGVHSLFLAEPRDATVTATTAMRVWAIRRPDFAALLADHPEIRRRLQAPSDIEERLRAPRYGWLEAGEQIVYFCRRHWTSLLSPLLGATLAVLTIGLVLLLVRGWLPPGISLLWPWLILLCVYGAIVLWYWVDWRNDYFAVSTWRISARERVAFIYEARNEAPLDRVQNINVTFDLLGRYLGYGNLIIETAAAGKMVFDHIPAPERMRRAIWDQIEKTKVARQAFQQHLVRKTLASHLDLQLGQVPADLVEDGETLDTLPQESGAQPQAGWLTRALLWLGEMDILPRTRIETDDSVTWRKHWVFLVQRVALPLLLFVVLAPASVLGFFGIPQLVAAWVPCYPYILLVLALVSLGWLWWETNDWGNDLYIVTRERIIDVDRKPLWTKSQRREASLGMIQNVRYEQPNLFAALLNYGNVIVPTAGQGPFTFERVANPRGVQNEVFRRIDAFREAQRERQRAEQRQDLAEWFSVYHGMKDASPAPSDSGLPEPPFGADGALSQPPNERGDAPR
jgi:hypothetical protein